MSGIEEAPNSRAGRVAGATAVVAAGGALACGVCCVLPFALPAAALALSGGALAWFGGLYRWAAVAAVVAVVASWAWIGWLSLRARQRPARSTWVAMFGATVVLAVALAWVSTETREDHKCTASVGQTVEFSSSGFGADVQIAREIREMDALGALLAGLDPDERERSPAEIFWISLAGVRWEKYPADDIDRDDGLGVILGHQQDGGVHRIPLWRSGRIGQMVFMRGPSVGGLSRPISPPPQVEGAPRRGPQG